MRTVEDIHKILLMYKSNMKGGGDFFPTGHAHGFYNGIEAALAIVEDRPAFFVKDDKMHNPFDVKRYPEHFV